MYYFYTRHNNSLTLKLKYAIYSLGQFVETVLPIKIILLTAKYFVILRFF